MQVKIGNDIVKIQVMPNDKRTQDETLDTFSFACEIDDKATPYDPMTYIEITNDDEEKINLILISDNVEIASFDPVKYLHNITAIQNTREYSKQLIRNSVFSQPYTTEKSSFSSVSLTLENKSGDEDTAIWSFPYSSYNSNYINNALILSSHEKIKKAFILLDVKCISAIVGSDTNPQWTNSRWEDLENWTSLVSKNYISSYPTSYTLTYTLNNNTYTYTLTENDFENISLMSNFPFYKKVRCLKIEELAANGADSFTITFPVSASDIVSGEQQPFGNGNRFGAFILINIKIIADIYYHNAYSILTNLQSRHIQSYKVNGFNGGSIRVQKRSPLFDSIRNDEENDLEDILKETYTPNLIFTQLTAFECINEVFSLLDATLKVDVDENDNKILDIEYFNDWDNKKYETADLKLTARNVAIGEDHFTNGLITYYQDGRAEVKTDWIPLRNTELGVATGLNAGVIVPFNIDIINEAFLLVPDGASMGTRFVIHGGSAIPAFVNDIPSFNLDISFFIVEESMWTYLDTAATGQIDEPKKKYQINTITYQKGGNRIDFSLTWKLLNIFDTTVINQLIDSAYFRMCGLSNSSSLYNFWKANVWDSDWLNKFFKINYIASVDGRTKIDTLVNKYDGETLVDQYNGAVDLNKMGVNLLGLSLKMGEPTLNIAQKICKWEDRIKKGEIYKYDGAYWIANVCAYTILPDGLVRTNVSFVKNFNALSMNTRLLREKRLSTISSALTQKSEDNIVDYIYVSTLRELYPYPETQPLVFSIDVIKDLIKKTLWKNSTYNKNIKSALFTSDGIGAFVYLPMHKYGSGNSICFEMSFDNPKSAGDQTKTENIGWLSATKIFTKPINYTDENGFFDACSIGFFSENDLTITQDFPYVAFDIDKTLGLIHDYEVYKQPNEVFALNYELCFLPLDIEKDFIGQRFINDNAFVNDDYDLGNEDIYFYYSTDGFIYSHLDRKAHGNTRLPITQVFDVQGTNYRGLSFRHSYIDNYANIKSWCLARENGDILFASNRMPPNAYDVDIYFYTRQKRI